MGKDIISGARFKQLRETSKLTQGQIAQYLEIDQSYVAKIEKGERQLTVNLLEQTCALFGCSEEYVLGKSDEHIPLVFAFRANKIQVDDLECIAAINKVAVNLRLIKQLGLEVSYEE